MLHALHQEHINIARLLDLLRQQLFAIRSEKPVRYRLMRDILGYLGEVSDHRHHPLEDLVYAYYLRYRSEEDIITARLKKEHELIIVAGHELCELVDMILMDAVIPLDQLTARLENFIVLQQRHMDYEEADVFPELRARLTEDDWRHLEQNWQFRTADDPLFGRQVSERYRDLSETLGLNAING